MKAIKKLNRGGILTVFVLLGLIIYLISLDIYREDQKVEIEQACISLFNIDSKSYTLPEQYKKAGNPIPENELNKYLAELESDYRNVYISNDSIIKGTVNYDKKFKLESQLNGIATVTSFKRDLIKVNSYVFEGNQVLVEVSTNIIKDIETLRNPTYDESLKKYVGNGSTIETSQIQGVDYVTLQNTDGKWKVAYANLTGDVKQQPMGEGNVKAMYVEKGVVR